MLAAPAAASPLALFGPLLAVEVEHDTTSEKLVKGRVKASRAKNLQDVGVLHIGVGELVDLGDTSCTTDAPVHAHALRRHSLGAAACCCHPARRATCKL